MKTLTLCADDFAQSPAISAGILELLAARRLAATSVMSQSPHWPGLAESLQGFARQADIGLHFNLTHPFDASARPLSHWLLASQLRRLSVPELTDQCLRQLDRFSEAFGRLPDFIDGHQHVHALPQVRAALFAAVAQRWPNGQRPYLRAPDRLGAAGDSRLKAWILHAVCAGFYREAQARGFACTPWFGGMYSLTPEADYPTLMQRWLTVCPDHSLMMCHPGHHADDPDDLIATARVAEFRYLASPAFAEHCQQQNVEIGRFCLK